MDINLSMLQNLCQDFNVEFKIETDGSNHIYYCFGPKVKWAVPINEIFGLEAYIGVVKRLSAHYPERVLNL